MYKTINNTVYWYEIEGKGEPVVFLHGFTGTGGTWDNIVARLPEDLQSLTIDLPGHGRTDSETPKDMERFSRDLVALFEYLQWTKVHLVGYSMGGRAALSFAVFYPDMVKSLTLESASPGLSDEHDKEERRQNDEQLAQRIQSDGVEAFVDFWENIPLFHTQKSLQKEVRNKIRTERLFQSAEGLAQSLQYMGTGAQPSWWDALQNFKVPVLLVAGGRDDKFTAINQSMQKQIPKAELTVVEGAGHAIHVEQPVVFGRIVSEFLKTV